MPVAVLIEFVVLAALWGASFLFMRVGAAEFGAVATAGLRVGLAALLLLPVFLRAGVWASFCGRWRAILFAGLLNSGIPFALYAFAVLHIPTGLASILNATVPLSGALVAWIWLKEKPGGMRALGLAIGFAGVCLLVLGKTGVDASGQSTGQWQWTTLAAMAAALGATICYGLAASFTKKHLHDVHPMATACGSQWGAALGLALPTLWFWPAHTPSAEAWWALLAVALLCTALAYILFFRIIAALGPSKALTVTFLVPVFALLYGALFLGEVISLWMLGCGAVILCGTALAMGLVGKR
jgi:drug/metabolite transporter (DMT)-like permease